MMYNTQKLLLSSAIALALGASGAAFANVNVDTGASPVTYAEEPLNGVADGTVNDAFPLTNLDLEGELGWSVGAAGAPRFMRFDFFNAELLTPLNPGDGDTTGNLRLTVGSGANRSVSIAAGGQPGDTFVIFEVTNTDGALDINTFDTFDLLIGNVLGNKQTAEVRYRAFEEGLVANNAAPGDPEDPNETFKDVQVDWFNWGAGYTVACIADPNATIDTANRQYWIESPFLPGANFRFARATAQATTGVLNPVGSMPGTQVEFVDYYPVASAAEFRVNGDFQGIDEVQVWEDTFPPGTNTATVAPFGPGTNPQFVGGPFAGIFNPLGYANAEIRFINGATRLGNTPPDAPFDEMLPSTYSIEFSQNGEPSADFVVGPDERTCVTTQLSGSNDRLDFVASADGSGLNRSLFRIVNPSDQDGQVVMKVTNDDGDSVGPFPIDEIDGIDSDTLAAGESSGVIQLSKAWAVAQNLGLTLAAPASDGTKRDKLRLEVFGNFGDNAYDGNLNFDVLGSLFQLIGDPQGGGAELFAGPGAAGLLRIRGMEQQGRSAYGIQIQGFMINDQNTVIPYNER